jgi:hypothetical protein
LVPFPVAKACPIENLLFPPFAPLLKDGSSSCKETLEALSLALRFPSKPDEAEAEAAGGGPDSVRDGFRRCVGWYVEGVELFDVVVSVDRVCRCLAKRDGMVCRGQV